MSIGAESTFTDVNSFLELCDMFSSDLSQNGLFVWGKIPIVKSIEESVHGSFAIDAPHNRSRHPLIAAVVVDWLLLG